MADLLWTVAFTLAAAVKVSHQLRLHLVFQIPDRFSWFAVFQAHIRIGEGFLFVRQWEHQQTSRSEI